MKLNRYELSYFSKYPDMCGLIIIGVGISVIANFIIVQVAWVSSIGTVVSDSSIIIIDAQRVSQSTVAKVQYASGTFGHVHRIREQAARDH